MTTIYDFVKTPQDSLSSQNVELEGYEFSQYQLSVNLNSSTLDSEPYTDKRAQALSQQRTVLP
jgi:hypothetical protein